MVTYVPEFQEPIKNHTIKLRAKGMIFDWLLKLRYIRNVTSWGKMRVLVLLSVCSHFTPRVTVEMLESGAKKKHIWNDEEDTIVIKGTLEGKPRSAIAAGLGLTAPQVTSRVTKLRELGKIPPPPNSASSMVN